MRNKTRTKMDVIEMHDAAVEGRGQRQVDSTIWFATYETSLGIILAARSSRGVCTMMLGDDESELRRELHARYRSDSLREGDGAVHALMGIIRAFIEAPAGKVDLPLDLRGTNFQREVWHALLEIPPGTTATYTEIAHRIGRPKSVRAVAQACAANRIAVLVPCHRVVRSDGSLSGYRWGVDRKRALLERELAFSEG